MPPARTVSNKIKNEITGVSLVAAAFLCLAGLYVIETGYISSSASIGAIGQLLVRIIKALTGDGKYLLPVFLGLYGARLIVGGRPKDLKPRIIGGTLFIFAYLVALHQPYVAGDLREAMAAGFAGNGGGVVGAIGAIILKTIFGQIGTWIVLTAGAVIAFLLLTGVSITRFLRRLWQIFTSIWRALKNWLLAFLFTEVDD